MTDSEKALFHRIQQFSIDHGDEELSYAINVGYRCPKCKKKQAMDETGKIQKRGRFRADLIEWKCKYCGEVRWKKDTSHSDAGGGGCGGCGGD